MTQTTIAKPVELLGIGLHKGTPVKLKLEPMKQNSGIYFERSDMGVSIKLAPESVVDTMMATVIGKNGVNVSTIEHLLSAVYAYGIDNLKISVSGDEVPIMDGSSIGFCMLLDEAGMSQQEAPKKAMLIKKEVCVEEGEKFVKLKPSDILSYDFKIKFDHPVIDEQAYTFTFGKKAYKNQIARARTFGFLHEVQYLRSKGLAQGGSLENAIVLDDKEVLNSEGLRFNDEFVRHKILDAIGDMALLGMPFIGAYDSFAGSHALNHKLTKALLADAESYEVVELGEAKEYAVSYSYA